MLLVFQVYMNFRLQANEEDFKIWDIDTITLNDFTVELKVTNGMWSEFLSTYDSDVDNLEKSLKEFIKDYINRHYDEYLEKTKSKEPRKELRVVMIELEFDNLSYLRVLKKHGKAVKSKNQKAIDKV